MNSVNGDVLTAGIYPFPFNLGEGLVLTSWFTTRKLRCSMQEIIRKNAELLTF